MNASAGKDLVADSAMNVYATFGVIPEISAIVSNYSIRAHDLIFLCVTSVRL